MGNALKLKHARVMMNVIHVKMGERASTYSGMALRASALMSLEEIIVKKLGVTHHVVSAKFVATKCAYQIRAYSRLVILDHCASMKFVHKESVKENVHVNTERLPVHLVLHSRRRLSVDTALTDIICPIHLKSATLVTTATQTPSSMCASPRANARERRPRAAGSRAYHV